MAAATAGGGANSSASLQYTPTWALATVCFIFIFLSLLIEHSIHLISNWLKRRRKTALFEAVEKLKSVLILLGFMSLILAVTQKSVAKICISNKVAYTMLPCRKSVHTKTTKALGYEHIWTDTFQKSLSIEGVFQHFQRHPTERILAATDTSASSDYCESKGKTSLISQQGMNQLSIFIFVLAVMQIVYSVITMALGRAKMKSWKAWEKETQTVEYLAANDPNRFRYARQTTFGRRHMTSWTSISLHLWIKCFFRQFFRSVAKVDYLTLRHGFISAHLSTNYSFNFQKYIQRSLEDDFKVVVGISPFMWLLVVIFLLVDVHGWHAYLWVSFLPLIIVLALGTKLEVIVARMALQIQEQSSVIKGAPLVQPNDNLFWFSHPQFVLTLLHFTLFTGVSIISNGRNLEPTTGVRPNGFGMHGKLYIPNAFELAFFVWVTLQYGIKSCYHEHTEIIITRVVLAVTVQVVCSYITLPLYALVTQMGSQFKSAVLEEQTASAIKQWHTGVREKRKKQRDFSQSPHRDNSLSIWSSHRMSSPDHDLSSHHRSPTFANVTDPLPTETEITLDHHQEINAQYEPAAPQMVATNFVQLKMEEVTKTHTY